MQTEECQGNIRHLESEYGPPPTGEVPIWSPKRLSADWGECGGHFWAPAVEQESRVTAGTH
jgi:hypothetical protein